MRSAVQVCVDYVADILDQYPDAHLLIEQELQIPSRVAPGEVWGTVDVAIYVPSLRLLYVVDYKHGVGVPVRLEGNKQTRGYAFGVLHAHPEWEVSTVALAIVQPRAPGFSLPIPEEWVPVQEILGFGDAIDDAILQTKAPHAYLMPGEAHCRFCPAAAACPARQQQALAVVGSHFGDVREVKAEMLPSVETMSPERMGEILRAADLVEDWFARVRAKALETARGGAAIPGFKVVEAMAKRHFVEGATLVQALTSIAWEEDVARAQVEEHDADYVIALALSAISGEYPASFRPPKLLGIGDTEALIKQAANARAPKGKKKEAVAEAMAKFALLTTKKSSGTLSLVPESDRRPAVDGAVRDFGGASVLPHVANSEIQAL